MQAAFAPQRVQAARDLDGRALPHIALEDLPVVADMLDDAIGPVVGESEPFTEVPLDAQQAADRRIVGFKLLVDIGLRDARMPLAVLI